MALGIKSYYDLAKEIRIELNNLRLALYRHIELERKFGFPIKLEYRRHYEQLNNGNRKK